MKNYAKVLDWSQLYYTLEDAKTLKPLMMCVRLLEALAYFADRQYDMSETRCINLYKTITEQKLADGFHKNLSVVLRKLNQWDKKKPEDRKEIDSIIAAFKKMNKEEEHFSTLYVYYFQMDEILQEFFAAA